MSTDRKTPRNLPIADWIYSYQKEWFRPDLIAGLTTAAVVIPMAMAYATIAGLPIQVGLYTAFVPMIVYAVLGTSRPLSVSTTSTIAILTATGLSEIVPNADSAALFRASAMLALLVGAILILASVLRLGFVANFISEPVLVGFKAGIGLVIVLGQVPKILGFHFAKGSFLHNILAIAKGAPGASLPTVVVGITMIFVLIGFKRFLPRAPAPLIAVAAGLIGASLGVTVIWCGASRPDSAGLALSDISRLLPRTRTMAGGFGYSSDEFYRDHRCWPCIYQR